MSNLSWIILLGLYAVIIIGGIHFYENKIKQYEGAISDYKRALSISKNTDHYTHLQIQNSDLNNKIRDMYRINELLQHQNEKLKKDNEDLINGILPQYESSVYKSSNWESKEEYVQEDLDFEQ